VLTLGPPSDFETRDGAKHQQPLFLPVYQPRRPGFSLADWDGSPTIRGIIVNAFFLYKQRSLRKSLAAERGLKNLVGFHRLVATDSGAFQGFHRRLHLSNRRIIRFQDEIGSDVIAPLDLITPPGDNRTIATAKLRTTQKRIEEGLTVVRHGILAGVQQGGRFIDLRHESVCGLLEMGVQYIAIGSLVPFFTTNHDLTFPAAVIADARREAGWELPIHVYGAGDPCELPFMIACGATIFDSASYGHYAEAGWYMTPYGALRDPGPVVAGEFSCGCSDCASTPITTVFAETPRLLRHNLWTICQTVDNVRSLQLAGRLEAYLEEVLAIHHDWFPTSRLVPSWRIARDSPALR